MEFDRMFVVLPPASGSDPPSVIAEVVGWGHGPMDGHPELVWSPGGYPGNLPPALASCAVLTREELEAFEWGRDALGDWLRGDDSRFVEDLRRSVEGVDV